jgi:hypothetical protein
MITTILYYHACQRSENIGVLGLFFLALVEWGIIAFNAARIGA